MGDVRARLDAPEGAPGRLDPPALPEYVRPLAGIAAAGFVVRLWYGLSVMHGRVLGYDALWYKTIAGRLADGHGFTAVLPLIPWHISQPTAKFGPLWPSLLSVVAWFGPRSDGAFRVVESLVGAASVFLIGRLGAVLVERRVGLVAAALAAVYPVLLAGDGSLMTETLYLFLLLVLLNLLATRHDLTYPAAAGAGALVGLAALSRGEGVLLLPLLVLPWLVVNRVGARRILATLAVAALAALAVCAPWLIRNEVAFHRVVLATDQALVIGGANCDSTYYGKGFGTWDITCLHEYEPGYEKLTEAERVAIYQRRGIDYLEHHKKRAVAVGAMRVARTWGFVVGGQLQLEANETRPLGALQVAWVTYLVLLPFALAGAWWLARRRRLSILLVMPPVIVTVLAFFTYGTQRARYSAEPVLLVLAATAMVVLYDRLRRARARRTG